MIATKIERRRGEIRVIGGNTNSISTRASRYSLSCQTCLPFPKISHKLKQNGFPDCKALLTFDGMLLYILVVLDPCHHSLVGLVPAQKVKDRRIDTRAWINLFAPERKYLIILIIKL